MVAALAIAAALGIGAIFVHHEALWALSRLFDRLGSRVRPRVLLLVVVGGAFVVHALEIAGYAAAYVLLDDRLGLGRMGGGDAFTFETALYFSATCYSSLGLGELAPPGPLRLVAATEALTGLLLIAWSASFTYLAMSRFWHPEDDPPPP